MAPIAALFDPNAPQEKGIQVFFVTEEKNLGLALRHAGHAGRDTGDLWAADKSTWEGNVLSKAEIGTATVEGVKFVVAMTQHKNENPSAKATVNDVSIVSPIYQVLDTTALTNTTAAITSSGDQAWVYYLSGTEGGKVDIKEYELNTGNIATFSNLNVDVDCSLAGYYDLQTNQRSIIFQERAEGHLKEYNVNTKQTVDISDTVGAKPNTAICVTYADGAAYVYYTDSYYNVYRVIKKQGNWGAHARVFNEKPDQLSQMSAVTANGVNHVFFQATGNKTITHVRDDAPSNGSA